MEQRVRSFAVVTSALQGRTGSGFRANPKIQPFFGSTPVPGEASTAGPFGDVIEPWSHDGRTG